MAALLRVARASGLGHDEARDAVQDTLLVFVERAGDYDGRAPVGHWLMGILYRKCLEQRRIGARLEPVEDMDDESQGRFSDDGRWLRPPLSPESWAARSQAMQWIADCMAALPDRRRLAFELRDVQQLGTDEICKILDVAPNTLGVLLFRARNALRECMEAKGMRGSDDVAM